MGNAINKTNKDIFYDLSHYIFNEINLLEILYDYYSITNYIKKNIISNAIIMNKINIYILNAFFSDNNIDIIQRRIKKFVYKMSGFKLNCSQNEQYLFSVMNDILTDNNNKQLDDLNKIIINDIVIDIINNRTCLFFDPNF